MKRLSILSVLIVALNFLPIDMSTAKQLGPSRAMDDLMRQAVQSIDAGQYLRATQLLTTLIAQRNNPYAARAQELLANVREANGQLAHAKAEYDIYLRKYPDAEGAARVRARLATILSAEAATTVNGQRAVRLSYAPTGVGGGATAVAPRAGGAKTIPGGYTVRDRGVATLTYRFNEGATKITDLLPAPIVTTDTDEVFKNAMTAGLQFSRIIDKGERRVKLYFAGRAELDFQDTSDQNFRISEALISFENTLSGRSFTFGRQRPDPQGIAYRLDGASLKWPIEDDVNLGAFLGKVVDSTHDDLFSDPRYLLGVSATFENRVGPGDLSIYAVGQHDGTRSYRQAVGAEYDWKLAKGGVYSNVEYDLMLDGFNRALISGALVLPNNGRLTGRLAYYRGPGLNLENALVGQPVGSIDELLLTYTPDQIDSLANDRSAKITTLGMTYFGKLNRKWDLALDGAMLRVGGTPASGGVAAVSSNGLRGYYGMRLTGSSVFMPDDQFSLGLRYANNDDNNLYLFETSLRAHMSDKWIVQPRLRLGLRDFGNGGGDERFIIPSFNTRYNISKNTILQLDLGQRWSRLSNSVTVEKHKDFFLTAGVSKSF
jgi:hypothetical protein